MKEDLYEYLIQVIPYISLTTVGLYFAVGLLEHTFKYVKRFVKLLILKLL